MASIDGTLSYTNGDVRKPVGDGDKIIVHCCNDIGAFGAGVALAISRKWPVVKRQYLRWYKSKNHFQLGNVQFVEAEEEIIVANLIGQKGIRVAKGCPPIRYSAIRQGLKKVVHKAIKDGETVHMPRMGAGLAKGHWPTIEAIVKETIVDKGINVFVYNFVPRK